MTKRQYFRTRAEGLAHRTAIRVLLRQLLVGSALPTGTALGHRLGIHPSEATRHLVRVLNEDGVRTELRGSGRGIRRYITAMHTFGEAA